MPLALKTCLVNKGHVDSARVAETKNKFCRDTNETYQEGDKSSRTKEVRHRNDATETYPIDIHTFHNLNTTNAKQKLFIFA